MSRNHRALNARRWAWTRQRVFERDRWRCVRCGRMGRLQCDHIIPLELDPEQDPYCLSGLQTLCVPCHKLKSASERPTGQNLPPDRRAWRELLEEFARTGRLPGPD